MSLPKIKKEQKKGPRSLIGTVTKTDNTLDALVDVAENTKR